MQPSVTELGISLERTIAVASDARTSELDESERLREEGDPSAELLGGVKVVGESLGGDTFSFGKRIHASSGLSAIMLIILASVSGDPTSQKDESVRLREEGDSAPELPDDVLIDDAGLLILSPFN